MLADGNKTLSRTISQCLIQRGGSGGTGMLNNVRRICLPGGSMAIHDLPQKWRDRAHGDAGLLACADELEAQLKSAALCSVSTGAEIHFELIVPDGVFRA